MQGKYQGHPKADTAENPEQTLQHDRVIHIGRAMQGNESIAPVFFGLYSGPLESEGRGNSVIQVEQQGINHHIADKMDLIQRNSLRSQITRRVRFGGKQQVGQLVSQDTVYLLRHSPVATTQSRFHVYDRNTLLNRHQGTGNSGIDIAHDQNRRRAVFIEYRLKPLHDVGSLLRMRTGPDLKVYIGFGNMQLIKEGSLHGRIVMLASVQQPGGQPRSRLRERPHYRGDFHKIRASAYYTEYVAQRWLDRHNTVPYKSILRFRVIRFSVYSSNALSDFRSVYW